ncbi:hypothetical protein [Kribbella lupini]|uniref:DUF308 domain-containing protein n=1 Tax=Kribbella lupini TaxID=291602 RepID=A0ABN2CEA8_9ACTN
MNGFRWIGGGTLIVLIDLRLSGFDVLVDLVGWALIYVGLRAVWRLDNALRIACGFAFLGAVFAVAELAFGALATMFASAVALVCVAVAVCTALMRVAGRRGEPAIERWARVLRSALVVVTLSGLALSPLMLGTYLGPALVLAAVTAVVVVASYVLLLMDRRVAGISTVSSQSIT